MITYTYYYRDTSLFLVLSTQMNMNCMVLLGVYIHSVQAEKYAWPRRESNFWEFSSLDSKGRRFDSRHN